MERQEIVSTENARRLWRLPTGSYAFVAIGLAAVMLLAMSQGALNLSTVGNTAVQTGSASHTTTLASAHAAPGPIKIGGVKNVKTGAIGRFGIISSTSGNWAGYAAVPKAGNGVIQEITAEWAIPTATCSQPASYGAALDSQWVGIDGFSTGTVEQTGTSAYCSSNGATPVYYLWWEFYPYNNAQFIYTASAGDFVQAYVLYNPAACVNSVCGVYDLILNDLTSGNSISVTGGGWVCNPNGGSCEGGVDSSAECISEQSGGGFVLTKVTKLTFLACAAEINGTFKGLGSFSSSTATIYSITQVNGSLTDQSVSSITSYFYGKSEFSVTWHHYN
jgi:Peptidase A4 family